MNNKILVDLSRNLLGAGYLDVQFLVNLIEEQELDFDEIYENVQMNFGKEFDCNINYFIYEALSQVAYKFIAEHEDLFEDNSDEFEIFTNYMDSHLRFNSDVVQTKFESLK